MDSPTEMNSALETSSSPPETMPRLETAPPRRQSPVDPRVVLAGGVCVVAAVALMVTGRPSTEAVVAQVHGVPVGQVETVATYAAAPVAEPPAAEVPVTPRPQRVRTEAAAVSAAPAATSTPVVTKPVRRQTDEELFPNPVTENLPPKRAASPSGESAAASMVVAGTKAPIEETVTVAGCLARDDDAFVLKDTSGEDAPTSRSWKSGFLKKRSSSITLIDEGYALRLPSHVGQRVEMRGVLVDREMRARSIKVMGVCD